MGKLTLGEAVRLSIDRYKYPDVIDVSMGSDFPGLSDRPGVYVEMPKERELRIIISSFRGIAIGAIHYYARIDGDGVILRDKENPGYSIYGYISKEFSKITQSDGRFNHIQIEVLRFLTDSDIERDPKRWGRYKLYSPETRTTSAFVTKQDAIDAAKAIIEARFTGDWKVVVED